jgi:hypothetical protein
MNIGIGQPVTIKSNDQWNGVQGIVEHVFRNGILGVRVESQEERIAVEPEETEEFAPVAGYREARRRGAGTRWIKPAFWPPYDEVAVVVHVGKSYILSAYKDMIYLSMGNADWQYVCENDPRQIERFVKRFEAPIQTSDACHYCGQPATSFGFFDEPICSECGGR